MARQVSGGRRPGGTRSRTSRREAPHAPASDEGLVSLRVRDLMVRSLVTVPHDAGLGTAENLMRTRRIRHLPVLDRARRLVGILTDRDLRRTLLDPALHERPRQLPVTLERVKVRDVMTIGTLAVRPEMDVREAARIMHERDIGALPVVADANRVVGMLTATDVMQYIVSRSARKKTRRGSDRGLVERAAVTESLEGVVVQRLVPIAHAQRGEPSWRRHHEPRFSDRRDAHRR